jgi:molecular chaperone HscB
LSRKFHPDYFYNASPAERLASLERSSYLNDAYRTLRDRATRIEHLLAIEGLPPAKSDDSGAKVPPALLQEVFELNEELDELRDLRQAGGDEATLRARLEAARLPIDRKRDEHERRIEKLSDQWDGQANAQSADRKVTLEALRELLYERKYIDNLLAAIEREAQGQP